MVQQSAPPGIWDEDPDGASILLATGRARHDLLVIAEPAFLRDLDQAWGRPSARVRLSFLPGVEAPSAPGHEDALVSYERGGLGVLVARGRTSMYEGGAARAATALARIASGARLRAALLVTRATPLRGSGDVAGGSAPGQVRVVAGRVTRSGLLGRRRRRDRLRGRSHGPGLEGSGGLRPDLPRRPGRRRQPRAGAALPEAGLRRHSGRRRGDPQKPAGRFLNVILGTAWKRMLPRPPAPVKVIS